MKVVILGAGRRGCALAEYLIGENADVVMIDNDMRKIEKVKDKIDCIAIFGNGNDMTVLTDAGVEDADFFVALTDRDEVNLISCAIVGSEFGIRNTVSCVKNIAYTSKGGLKNNLFGIGFIVNPEEEAASNICNAIERGLYSSIITFEGSDLALYNIEVDDLSALKGKTLMEIRRDADESFIIASILRNGKAMVPSGQTAIRANDMVSIVVGEGDANKIFRKLGFSRPRPKRIVFQGLNQISDYILSSLSPDTRKNIVLIDKDKTVCEEFSRKYNNNIVLNANLMNDDIIEEENLADYDLFVALEDSDELNTIIAHFAKKKGIRHSIALCKREDGSALKALDIDLVISATESTVVSLYKLFQTQSNISSVHTIFGGEIEVDEIMITENSAVRGKRLKDIDVRQKAIVAGVRKSDESSFIPNGSYLLEAGDTLLVLISSNRKKEIKNSFTA
ncbi:MAG TPA: Trk system potassium transporter TrkA [Spirochaetaceae bacterium]|nr:Trk system potassium transporter TrkA [Spirochaetaceae bacterium]